MGVDSSFLLPELQLEIEIQIDCQIQFELVCAR